MDGQDPMNGRRTTEQLLADARERVRVTEQLPERVAGVRGWAANGQRSVRATVDVHGALTGLDIDESALAAGPDELGREIVRIAGKAHQAALRQSVDELGTALGDAQAHDMLRSAGLGDQIEPDAPVLPYVPGVDPNAHTWNVIPPGR